MSDDPQRRLDAILSAYEEDLLSVDDRQVLNDSGPLEAATARRLIASRLEKAAITRVRPPTADRRSWRSNESTGVRTFRGDEAPLQAVLSEGVDSPGDEEDSFAERLSKPARSDLDN